MHQGQIGSEGPTTSPAAHLWAIGYDHMGRADEVRDEIIRLAKLPPPRLPELPPPAPAQIEHKPDAWEEMMMAVNAAMPDPFGRSPEQLHGQTED